MPVRIQPFGYNLSMQYRWLVICLTILCLATPALAQSSPVDAIAGHFAAISAEEYIEADLYFSSAFQRAFKAEQRATVDQYYLTRRGQLNFGFEIIEVLELADEDRETSRVTVEFGDPYPEAPVGITERLYYYLIRQKVDADAPLADTDQRAWRIDIFDALGYDTLAEARRRPYLYTRQAWAEDESRELKSRQGLFRVQLALSRYYEDHGEFPFRLRGGDNRRDELISGGYLQERYPPCGFSNRPMEAMEFGKKSSGDFAYYSIDQDGDDRREGYWLLLHGKVRESYYYKDHDTIYIMSSSITGTQQELAERFSRFWVSRGSEYLVLSEHLLAQQQPVRTGSWIVPLHDPLSGRNLDEPASETAPLKPVSTENAPFMVQDAPVIQSEVVVEETPVNITAAGSSQADDLADASQFPTVREVLARAQAYKTADMLMLQVSTFFPGTVEADAVSETDEPLELLLPAPEEHLSVHSYGW